MTAMQLLSATLSSAFALGVGVVATDVLDAVSKAQTKLEHVHADTKKQSIEAAQIMLELKTGSPVPASTEKLVSEGYLKPEILDEAPPPAE